MSHIETTTHDHQVQHSQEKIEYVNVYIRNSQKRAYVINIKRNIHVEELRNIISDKLSIQKEKLYLVLKG